MVDYRLSHMKRSILLIDDSADDVQLVKEVFAILGEDYELTATFSGAEALSNINKGLRCDLIFLDLNMPQMNGFEVLREIRGMSGNKSLTPVIILTNSQSHEDVARAYLEGANAYIRKQLGFENMLDYFEKAVNFWFKVAITPPMIRLY